MSDDFPLIACHGNTDGWHMWQFWHTIQGTLPILGPLLWFVPPSLAARSTAHRDRPALVLYASLPPAMLLSFAS